MAAKVTFDAVPRLIRPNVSPDSDGIITLNVQVDLYSDGKEDWLADTELQKFRFPVLPIGGQVVSAGQLGATYLLTDGWRIDPNLSSEIVMGVAQVGVATVFGGSGTNEAVRQGFQLIHDGYVREGFLTVRRVGNPTDDLRVEIKDGADVVYESVSIPGGAMDATFTEEFFGSEFELPALKDIPLFFEFTRTGSRDTNNYYELALDGDVYASGEAEGSNSGVWSSLGGDIVLRARTEVPYQLQLIGNLFTDSGLPVVVPAGNVNVQQTVSTLVEVRTDETAAADLSLMRKILDNGLRTDPATGKLTLFDDDGTTPIRQWDIFEDIAGTQPYRGQGTERRDAPVEV